MPDGGWISERCESMANTLVTRIATQLLPKPVEHLFAEHQGGDLFCCGFLPTRHRMAVRIERHHHAGVT
jgi:hypothetical protein